MRRTRVWIAVVLAVAAAAAQPAGAEVYGVVRDTVANDFRVGLVAPGTGAISGLGPVLDIGPHPGGVYDVDPATRSLYFVSASGAVPDTYALWTVNLGTGELIDAAPLTPPANFDPLPGFLEFDAVNDRILAIVRRTTDNKKFLARIDPTTGNITLIGSGFLSGGYSSGVSDFDAAHQIFYLMANVSIADTNQALYRVNATTGALIGSAVLTTDVPGLDLHPGFLAYDPTGDQLLAIVNLSPNKVLVSIAPTTGAVTAISAPIAATGYSSGVSDFDAQARIFYFAANEATNTTSTLFRVEADGTILPAHAFASSDPDIDPAPIMLVVPEPAAVAVGAASLAALCALARRSSTWGPAAR